MGFRTGTICKVWQVKPKSETMCDMRISISRRDRESGEYVNDFSGFVSVVGREAVSKVRNIHDGDLIRLGDVDVTNTYNKEKNITYTSFKVFGFEKYTGNGQTAPATKAQEQSVTEPEPVEAIDDENLPW